eukprot:GEMP01044010.1.p1 GENE.GEMP01044010.1~~GEMP01044010.1.p1  ORF type:complete len:282 (+),score=58.85 GEMP01044010.1:393-1238(+)
MHGLNDDRDQARVLFRLMEQDDRNVTYACSIPLFEGLSSVTTSLPSQVSAIILFIRAKSAKFPGNYQLVCHSMGALSCRAVLQEMDDHRVERAILIAGPLEGIYSDEYPTVSKIIHTLAYQSIFQNHVSVANLWRDPAQHENYITSNAFIPVLDGHRMANESEQTHATRVTRYRNNVKKAKKIFLLASPADEVVTPWQTSHFGFYAHGDASEENAKVESYEKQVTKEALGLDDMVMRGAMSMITVPDISHTWWCYRENVVRAHVLPRLGEVIFREKIVAQS